MTQVNIPTHQTTDCVAVILTSRDRKILLQRRDHAAGIDFPGHLSLIAGRVVNGECPNSTLLRELLEELGSKNEQPILFGNPTYLGCEYRNDRPWMEYVFHVSVHNRADELTIREGVGAEIFDFCSSPLPEDLAPHHKRYLIRYLETIKVNCSVEQEGRDYYIMNKIENFFSLKQLGLQKDYPALEKGTGYVDGSGDAVTAGIHTECDAQFLALLTFKQDVPRGFHYHLRKVENMVVLSGKLECKLELAEDRTQVKNMELSPGQVLRILPGCIHTYTAIGSDVQALEFAPQRYEESDVIVCEP
jgi:8-oxo-dGTP pyrophosphatase MutT (NUDIX family)/quercetin dioxygenase-like cupin family protein